MKKIIILLTLFYGMLSQAQDTLATINIEKKLIFGTNLSAGTMFKPKDDFGISLGLEFKNNALLGFGVFLNSVTYNAPNLNRNPSLDEIENYDPQTDPPFVRSYIDGSTKDHLSVFTFHVSKGFSLSRQLITDFQIGPSINVFNISKYKYKYDPGFASFSGSVPYSFWGKASESKLIIIGLNVKASLLYSMNTNTVLSVSPFMNFNKELRVYGLHLGFVFGKKYKRNLFNK
ncbi:hypothetical protein [uncultured Winogradskyella sp.]|uniref:hypothetical protein n=1 Tax=uncultured Winogradskyella sp. TaxID=395353 RepID=UPI002606FE6A|nr:hypothetical protein [uncultured Winogradskyella sp.]